VLFVILALMRPQWGFKWQEVKKQGIDILIALDTSKSMLAEDVLPNRLDRSKLAIKDLVRKLKGDRIGLVVFSGTAFLQCPLTVDYDGFVLALDDVDINSIQVGGTSIANAIYKAIDSYKDAKSKEKVLIIITDGEDLEGGLERAVEKARYHGIQISSVGIGSAEGELIPIKRDDGKMSFLKDTEGNVVKTRLDESVLRKLASATGGMYIRATGSEFGLDMLYSEKLEKMEKQEIKSRMKKQFYERFQLPLVFVLLLLFIEPFIGNRKREELGK
jgi:Ca-activated chloride channel family protein